MSRNEGSIGVVHPHALIHSQEHGVFVEHIYHSDFVFSVDKAECKIIDFKLASLSANGLKFDLLFKPKSLSSSVARLLMTEDDKCLYDYEFPELTERANFRQVSALPEYGFLLRTLKLSQTKASKGSGMPFWGVSALVVMCLLTSLLLFSGGSDKRLDVVAKQAQKTQTEKPLLLGTGDQLNAAEKVILSKVVSDSGIEWSTGGKPFVVFSDPNCPACRELETRLATLDKSLSAVIVPVSFKKNSKEAVAGVLCASDVAKAWKLAAAGTGDNPVGQSCIKGELQAESNNAAFVALHFDSTPTIVTSSGKVAAGAKDFEGLVRWIKENSGD